jgi:hypothetical protein
MNVALYTTYIQAKLQQRHNPQQLSKSRYIKPGMVQEVFSQNYQRSSWTLIKSIFLSSEIYLNVIVSILSQHTNQISSRWHVLIFVNTQYENIQIYQLFCGQHGDQQANFPFFH